MSITRITWSEHVRRRLVERGINQSDAERAILEPERVFVTPTGSVCHEIVVGHNILKVWLVPGPLSSGNAIVKSAAWKYDPK